MRMLLLAMAMTMGTNAVAETEFERVVGGADLDRGVFVSPTRDGGYVAIGLTKSHGEGEEDVYFVRTDAVGKVTWEKTYGGSGNDNGWSVQETESGFLLAGFTQSFGDGGFDCYLVKTNAEGEVQWSKTYGGKGDDRCWALIPASDGGYVMAGETKSYGAGAEDCYLLGIHDTGRKLWSSTFGGKKGDRCFSLEQADDGGFLLVGQTYSEGAGDRDVYLVKTDARGKLEWSKTFGGTASDVGHSVTKATDGDFVVIGYTTSFATEGDDDPYLIKIDAGGETQWTRVVSLNGSNHTLTGEVAGDGGFFLGGFSVFRAKGGNAALLVKVDDSGQLEWSKNVFYTTTGRSFGYTVRATPDGGCVLTGHTTEGGAGDLDLFLVKWDKENP